MAIRDLSEAERRVWEASSGGAWVDFRTGDPAKDDPAKADDWGPERAVRAEVITALLLGAGKVEPGYRPAVRLRGAWITGRLDLMGATVDRPLVCEYCVFDGPLRCVEAVTKTIRIVACRFPSFNGARMRTQGILNFYDCDADQGVRLDRAKVDGEVSFRGARLGPNQEGVALAAEGMTVDGPVECNAGFAAKGSVLLRGIRVEGALDFSDAEISAPGGSALVANRAVINGPFRADRLVTEGQVRLMNAHIAADMGLDEARLRDPGGIALSCGGLVIHGGIWCGRGFTAEGELRFIGAELRATLSLRHTTLSNPGRTALNLDRASLGDLNGDDLTVNGGLVSLLGTRIVGQMTLERTRLGSEDDEITMWLDGATIGGSLRLPQVRILGELRVWRSTIRGTVVLNGAQLSKTDEIALQFTTTDIGATVACDDLVADGEVRFTRLSIGRHLRMGRVCLINPGGVALDVQMLQAAEVSLLPAQSVQGSVILDHARIGLLRDDPEGWPRELHLDGLTYEALQPSLPARRRLEWLARDPNGYQPQPYEQLAAHYTRTGQPVEARRVLHAKERRQRGTKPFLGRLWSVLQDATVAYGYQPWRPVLWLALLLAIGGVTYGIERPQPLKADEAPHFNSVIYTLDLLLPIVDLGQERAFNPAGAQQWFSYFLIAAGWILATTIAAGVARILSRR